MCLGGLPSPIHYSSGSDPIAKRHLRTQIFNYFSDELYHQQDTVQLIIDQIARLVSLFCIFLKRVHGFDSIIISVYHFKERR